MTSREGVHPSVERGGIDAEPRRITSDFVEREQAVVVVERRIFDPLGRHGDGELLELPYQLGFEGASSPSHQNVLEDVGELGVEVGALLREALEGDVEQRQVVLGGGFCVVVG